MNCSICQHNDYIYCVKLCPNTTEYLKKSVNGLHKIGTENSSGTSIEDKADSTIL